MKLLVLALIWASLAAFAAAARAEGTWPIPDWPRAAPADVGMDEDKLNQAARYAQTAGGSGYIIRGGKLVLAWGRARQRYDLKSTTKSIGVTALGLALADGKLKGLSDKADTYHPALGADPPGNLKTGHLGKITIAHLATQTGGFEKPGGYGKLLFAPGTKWCYSDGGPNWLAECITLIYKQDLKELMFQRVFTPLGITPADLTWRRNAYRPATIGGIHRREFGSGISANVDAMARIGYLYLRAGKWRGKQIIPESFVDAVRTTPPAIKGLPVVGSIGRNPPASNHYGLLWWNNADGAIKGVPKDAYFSWGLHDSHIVVIPSLDIVVARAGRSWKRTGRTDYEVFGSFIRPIVASVRVASTRPAAAATTRAAEIAKGAPYPPSKRITKITWAPVSSIIRKARGSDNWPITWSDDDCLYTAYGDGWGFVPKVRGKLSLGFAKVSGAAGRLRGVNIRSATGEHKGDGRSGKKASGMLCVGGVLYMWIRNADGRGRQSQLAVSSDHAKTWKWTTWRFAEFGYPCFLNFGRNYAGARDEYVYAYSPDTPDAYKATDRVVLMRVPMDKIARRSAYEFFVKRDASSRCIWTADIAKRGAVFTFPGGCNRIDVVHNAPLKRYLMTMRSRAEAGGKSRFGIYDAPEPWGPWTTVFHAESWDVDPGESQHIPSKWISKDGKTIHLLFAGNDCFAVRRATLAVAKPRK